MVFIRARRGPAWSSAICLFQSLNRDGVHSRLEVVMAVLSDAGFNPSIGMVFIRANVLAPPVERVASFNPSIGMVFIRAA